MIRSVVVLSAIFFFLISTPSKALTDDEMCALYKALLVQQKAKDNRVIKDSRYCRGRHWWQLIPKPLEDILTLDERAHYDKAIANKRCDNALELLAQKFEQAHPKVPSILTSKTDYEEWITNSIPRHFPALGLCHYLQNISRLQAELGKNDKKTEPFRGFNKSLSRKSYDTKSSYELDRHLIVYDMMVLSSSGKRSKWDLALLKLSDTGIAVRFHSDFELLLAYRAHKAGLTDPLIVKWSSAT